MKQPFVMKKTILAVSMLAGCMNTTLIYALENSTTPTQAWWQNQVVYQVYPRSFQDSNGDGVGDLKGIIQRLDHIKSLGADVIWIGPFFKGPSYDMGYDIVDYRSVDPLFGTMSDFDQLVQEIHRRDMKVMLDMVFCYTSAQHPWFQESASSINNPKSDWYVWANGKGSYAPNNWINSSTFATAWKYAPARNQWSYGGFTSAMPHLNLRNPEVIGEHRKTMQFWLDKKVDGFRFDLGFQTLVNTSFENITLVDNLGIDDVKLPTFVKPLLKILGLYTGKSQVDKAAAVSYWQDMRTWFEQNSPQTFLLGELGYVRADGQKDGLHVKYNSQTNGMLGNWKASEFIDLIKENEVLYPYPKYQPTYLFGNHDYIRLATRVKGDLAKAKIVALLQGTLRGTPMIYQGEEIGMVNGTIPDHQATDFIAQSLASVLTKLASLVNLDLPFVANRDNVRTPMQWTEGKNAGFSSTARKTWVSINPDYRQVNVATEENDPNSMLNTYKNIFSLRKNVPALQKGSLALLANMPKNVIGYERQWNGQKVWVLINMQNTATTMSTAPLGNVQVKLSLGNAVVSNEVATLPAQSALVLMP